MRNINELPECPVATTISLVGNKWKLLIIRNLTKRTWRFNELQKSLNGISQKVLTDSLRQLESDGIIFRKDYHTNPPKVEYGMTDLGLELSKMLDVSDSYLKKVTRQLVVAGLITSKASKLGGFILNKKMNDIFKNLLDNYLLISYHINNNNYYYYIDNRIKERYNPY